MSTDLGKTQQDLVDDSYALAPRFSEINQTHSPAIHASHHAAQRTQMEAAAYTIQYPPVPDRTYIWRALSELDDVWIATLLLRISDTQARVAWEIWEEHKKRQNLQRSGRYELRIAVSKKWKLMRTWRSEAMKRGTQAPGTTTLKTRTASVQFHASAGTASTTDFDEEARAIWYVLKKEHIDRSEIAQMEAAPEVYREVIWMINYIQERATMIRACFHTKKNALEVLRNIGETICDTPSVLGEEIRERFRGGAGLRDAMIDILKSMDYDERNRMANINDCRSTFHERVTQLSSLGATKGMFGEMMSLAAFLRGEITMKDLEMSRNPSCVPTLKPLYDGHIIVLDTDLAQQRRGTKNEINVTLGRNGDCSERNDFDRSGIYKSPSIFTAPLLGPEVLRDTATSFDGASNLSQGSTIPSGPSARPDASFTVTRSKTPACSLRERAPPPIEPLSGPRQQQSSSIIPFAAHSRRPSGFLQASGRRMRIKPASMERQEGSNKLRRSKRIISSRNDRKR